MKMIARTNKGYAVYLATMLLVFSGLAYSQTTPIIGTVSVDLGGPESGSIGTQITIPVNIDVTNVSATDVDGQAVNAVLGNYRIAIGYDNTQIKALVNAGFIDGGTTAEFSNAVTANIISNGASDLLLLNASQLNTSGPLGLMNVAQIPFDITSLLPGTATLSVSVIDLRTPIIVTGVAQQPIIGGVALPFQAFDVQIDIQAAIDVDGDGLPDAWEQLYPGFIVGVDESAFDNDLDGLSNLEEYLNGTNPISSDSDGDQVPDGYEVVSNTDPTDENSFPLWVTSQPVVVGSSSTQYLYQIVANKPVTTYALTISPVGMVIQADGLITWNVSGSQAGTHDVTVSISGNSETAEQMFTIVVAGDGDVNGDGNINVADYLLLQQHVLGVRVLAPDQQIRADLYVGTGDGVINLQDLILLAKKVLGF